jgi:Spx/MgsR family transcriptional regulator
MITIYGIPNCDSVKRARTWLEGQGLAYQFHNYKKSGLPEPDLQRWLAELGWEKLLNRAGTTWRRLDDAAKAEICDASSAAILMRAQSSVIKRPIVAWADGSLSIGFSPELFALHARL